MKIKRPDCYRCKNKGKLDDLPPTCLAFRKGIPKKIFYENYKHTKRLPEQDNNIVFEESQNERNGSV